MSRFFYAHEIAKPKDVIPYLARPERHWKKGYSAYELAHSWVHADNIPASVRSFWTPAPTGRALSLLRACSSAMWTCGREGVEARPTCSPSSSWSTATP